MSPTRPKSFVPRGVVRYDRTKARKAAHRFYDSRAWRRLRRSVLAGQPLCEWCQARGLTVPGSDVDHVEAIEDRPDRALDPDNLRVLCRRCHNERHGRGPRE